jgi:hypothetical protein
MNRNDVFNVIELYPEGLTSKEITNKFLRPGEDPRKKFNSTRKLLGIMTKSGDLEKDDRVYTLSKKYLIKKMKDKQFIEENHTSLVEKEKKNKPLTLSLEHRIKNPIGIWRMIVDDFVDQLGIIPPEILLCKSVYKNLVSLFCPVISQVSYARLALISGLYLQLGAFYTATGKKIP